MPAGPSYSLGFKITWYDASKVRAQIDASYNASGLAIRAIRINPHNADLNANFLLSLKFRTPDFPF